MMKLKQLTTIIFGFSLVLLLSWCGKPEVIEELVKQPYYLTVQPLTKSDQAGTISKNAKVLGTSEIIITSQVAGRVTAIATDIGANVSNGQTLIRMSDTAGSIRFGLEKTQLAMQSAQNSYDVQKANLEKQIQDAQIALQRSQLAADTTRSDTSKQLEKIDYDLTNVNGSSSGSSTQIQLENLTKQLTKAQLDYQTKLDADSQTLDNFIITAGNINTDIRNLMSDVVTESDKLLWVSDEWRSYNDAYEVYLGAKDFASKNKAENALRELQSLQDDLDTLSTTTITQDNLVSYLSSYNTIISSMNTLIREMKNVFTATIPSSSLSQVSIDSLNTQYNVLATRSSAVASSITAQVNAINSFLATYQQSQQSIAQQVEILKSQISLTQKWLQDAQFNTQLWADRTKTSLDSNLQNSQLSLDSTKLATDFVTNTKDLNLQTIRNQLASAQVALNELNFNAAKYNVASPIRGIVSDVLVDIGQEVSPWTPLARVVSNTQQVEINMTESELQYLSVWQDVVVSNEYQTGSAVIDTVARVASKDGTFKVIISIIGDGFSVGSFVDVAIPLYEWNLMVPINAVNIVDVNRGQIKLWDGSGIVLMTVWLGWVFGEMVEVTDQIAPGMMLIVSDVTNYDPSKYQLDIKREREDVAKKSK